MSWLLDLSKFYRTKSSSMFRASEINWNTEIKRATSLLGCECYREQLSAMIDGELAPTEVVRVESHLEGCAECRRELDALNEYHTSIRSLAEVETPGSLLGSIQEALRQEALRQEALRQEALRTEAAGSSCRQIGSLLSAYIDSEITLIERERVQAHTASCRACAAQLKALRRTSRLVGSLPSIDPPADLRAQVLARTSRRRHRTPVFSFASAGLLAAVAIGVYLFPFQPAEPGGSDVTAVQAVYPGAPVGKSAANTPGITSGITPGIAPGITSGSVRGLTRSGIRTDRPLIAVRPGAIRSTSGVTVRPGAGFSPGSVFSLASADHVQAAPDDVRAWRAVSPVAPISSSKQRPHRARASHALSSGAEFIPDSVRADPAVSWPGSGAPVALAPVAESRASASGGAPNNPTPMAIAMRPSEPDSPTPTVQVPTVHPVAPVAANLSPLGAPGSTPPFRHSEMVLASVQQSDLTEGVWSEDQTARNQRWTQTANLMVESNLHSSRLMSARARGASRSINGSPVLTAAASRPFQF